jgi:isopenicillin N synthase-like dioxygenase
LNLSPEDSLCQYHASSLFDLSLIHYPAISAGRLSSGGLTRNPAHSDFGILTLLFQDEVGGLEIADTSSTSSEISARVERSGRFVHIDPKPGTVIINVGYLLMRWSNGRWKNTVHRVSEPPHWKEQGLQGSKFNDTAERGGGSVEAIPERYSIAYFSAPDPATVVEALPCCCRDQAPRWKPVIAGEYLRRKRAAMYI